MLITHLTNYIHYSDLPGWAIASFVICIFLVFI